jgi:hypothetical protein
MFFRGRYACRVKNVDLKTGLKREYSIAVSRLMFLLKAGKKL